MLLELLLAIERLLKLLRLVVMLLQILVGCLVTQCWGVVLVSLGPSWGVSVGVSMRVSLEPRSRVIHL